MDSLYEISKDVEIVVREVMDAEGVLSADLEKRLDEISTDFKTKSTNIGRWILNIEANEPGIEKEIARLQKRLSVQNNLKERLEKYLKFCMENAGLDKVESEVVTISIDKNPPSVAIDNEEDLPARYIRIEQTKTIDKKSISRDLKDGKIVSGAHLVTDRTHIRIR